MSGARRAGRVRTGEIFELSSPEAAWILDVGPAAYRKRLERARQRVRAFMGSTCGIVNPAAFCRCARRVETAVAIGRVDPRRPDAVLALPRSGRFPLLG